jgi:hypothetical protein
LSKGDIIQIQRKGFYICDRPGVEGKPLMLIAIPDGRETSANAAVDDSAKKLVKPSEKENSSSTKGVKMGAATGDGASGGGGANAKKMAKMEKKEEKKEKKKETKKADQMVSESVANTAAGGGDSKKQTKLGMEVRKDENYSEWYSQVWSIYSLTVLCTYIPVKLKTT